MVPKCDVEALKVTRLAEGKCLVELEAQSYCFHYGLFLSFFGFILFCFLIKWSLFYQLMLFSFKVFIRNALGKRGNGHFKISGYIIFLGHYILTINIYKVCKFY